MMTRVRPMFAMLSLVATLSAFSPAGAQDRSADQKRKALGSRVGDREQDVNNAGLSGDRRTSKRIDSRIDSRLNTRLDRFYDPLTSYSDAYTPKTDDGTKKR
jgi:hypothetical protein